MLFVLLWALSGRRAHQHRADVRFLPGGLARRLRAAPQVPVEFLFFAAYNVTSEEQEEVEVKDCGYGECVYHSETFHHSWFLCCLRMMVVMRRKQSAQSARRSIRWTSRRSHSLGQ